MGIVLPSINHFMSRLRELLRKSANRRRINLNTNVIEDLKLMLFFLEEAHIGVKKTNKSLQIIFMPCRLGRIQQRWLCLEILHPFMVKVSSLK